MGNIKRINKAEINNNNLKNYGLITKRPDEGLLYWTVRFDFRHQGGDAYRIDNIFQENLYSMYKGTSTKDAFKSYFEENPLDKIKVYEGDTYQDILNFLYNEKNKNR